VNGFTDRMRGLGAELLAAGLTPPVLMLADTATVAALAPTWLIAFDEVGWIYRVRVCGDTSDDEAALAAEARSLSAGTIVGVGDERLRETAAAAAARAGIPCLTIQPTP
jgi:glycerol dehydrogenase-like iron-containing ADH family enzyme